MTGKNLFSNINLEGSLSIIYWVWLCWTKEGSLVPALWSDDRAERNLLLNKLKSAILPLSERILYEALHFSENLALIVIAVFVLSY